MSATYLSIDDGLKRACGYLDDDSLLDDATLKRMKDALVAAEFYVQGAIGQENQEFYQKDEIKDLYKLACNAIAANWFNHPTSAVSSTTAKQIIGQLRGSYDSEVEDNGTTTEC